MNSLPTTTEKELGTTVSVKPLRLGVVRYLNMRPLIHGLNRWSDEELHLIEGTPGELADWLEEDRINMGMVPVVSLFTNPEWHIVGNNMIGSDGPVRSVLLVGNDPAAATRLYMDNHSRTSNMLASIILQKQIGNNQFEIADSPSILPTHPGTLPGDGEVHVLIGSHANSWISRHGQGTVTLRDSPRVGCLDLGECWSRWTGLPFVYAVWAIHPNVRTGIWPKRLDEQLKLNLSRIGEVISACPNLEEEKITAEKAKDYLLNNIQFTLDERAVAGLNRFYQLGVELDLFPPGWKLRR